MLFTLLCVTLQRIYECQIFMRVEGKQQMFKELFAENYSRLYHAALYLIKDSESAKDIVNDTFAIVWEEYRKGRNINQINFSYLYRIVHSRSIDMLRHHDVENRYALLYKQLNQEVVLAEDEEKDRRLDTIYHIIEQMPPRTRFVMEQCYFENKKYNEVADILGVTRDGIRMHVMKGLTMLRNAFSVKYKKGQ